MSDNSLGRDSAADAPGEFAHSQLEGTLPHRALAGESGSAGAAACMEEAAICAQSSNAADGDAGAGNSIPAGAREHPAGGSAQQANQAPLPAGAGPSGSAAPPLAAAEPAAAGGASEGGAPAALAAVEVRAADWREALKQAPEPCARRQGLAALSARAAAPLPARLAPVLAPALAALLAALRASGVPLPRYVWCYTGILCMHHPGRNRGASQK